MTQLKISDLSVGDWIHIDEGSTPVSIKSIHSGSGLDYVIVNDNFYDEGIIVFAYAVKPIPITPEILEKNGFAFLPDDNPRHLRFVDGNIFISTYEGRETFALCCYNDMGWAETFSQTLRYIHQLQHALRLAGIEKEIVL